MLQKFTKRSEKTFRILYHRQKQEAAISERLPIGEIWLERSGEQLNKILRFALAANKQHIHTFIQSHFNKALNRDQKDDWQVKDSRLSPRRINFYHQRVILNHIRNDALKGV